MILRILFSVLLALATVSMLVLTYFYFVGLDDGTVRSGNMGRWMLLLGAAAGFLFLGAWLGFRGRPTLACLLLLVPALPTVAFGLILLLFALNPGHHH